MKRLLVGLVAFATLLVGCGSSGQSSPPDIATLERNSQIVEFHLPNGSTMPCLYYAAKGTDNRNSNSQTAVAWLILDCNWSKLRGPG